MKEDLKGK